MSRFSRFVPALLGLLLLAPAMAGAMPTMDSVSLSPPTSQFIVGFDGAPDPLAVELAGGTVLRVDAELAFVVAQTTLSLADFQLRLDALAPLRYVQLDSRVAHDGASADGSQWDGAQWDGAQWDGAQWDGSQWDGAQWDGSQWDGAQWDGATWDGTAWDGSQWDGAQWDGSQWDGAQWDASQWDGAQWDGASSDGSSPSPSAMDPGYPYQWGHGAVRLPGAWATSLGHGDRIVCVVDTGVDYTHPDLAQSMWRAADGSHGYNVLTKKKDPMDDAGHGTHVAGIVAAQIGNGLGIAGVTRAQIMAVKVLAADGSGFESDVASGIKWCADKGAHIVTLSLGGDLHVQAAADAVAYAQSKGLLLFASGGNAGCDCTRYPASYAGVVGVGAIDARILRTGFSNTGAHIDLAAPGFHILSTTPNNHYAVGSGTSQATPYAAGVAALVWSNAPHLSAAQVASVLFDTARDRGAAGVDKEYGHGVPDADAALAYVLGAS